MDLGSEDEMQAAPAQIGARKGAKENAAPATKKTSTRSKTASATSKSAKSVKMKGKEPNDEMAAGSETKRAEPARSKRRALQDISNEVNGSDVEDVHGVEEEQAKQANTVEQSEVVEHKSKEAKAPVNGKRGRKPKQPVTEDIMENPESQQDPVTSTAALRPENEKDRSSTEFGQKEVPETQPMELDQTDYVQPTSSIASRASKATSKGRPKTITSTHEAGSVEDLAHKLDVLQVKFDELRDTGVVQAESALDKLQQVRRREKQDAEAYIKSLKTELATQKAQALESSALRKQVTDLNSQLEGLRDEKKTMNNSLSAAQAEIKALQAKLSATRSGSADNNKGSHNNGPARTILVGSEEAKRDMQKRALKEDLYTDLTGLIIREVKRKDGQAKGPAENVFDCLQTGRNGALHFHLSVPESNGGTNFDDDEFSYTPLLDEQRDSDLIDLLPDYLTEEICFPRNNAVKFYSRVADCLTRKVDREAEDEEGE